MKLTSQVGGAFLNLTHAVRHAEPWRFLIAWLSALHVSIIQLARQLRSASH